MRFQTVSTRLAGTFHARVDLKYAGGCRTGDVLQDMLHRAVLAAAGALDAGRPLTLVVRRRQDGVYAADDDATVSKK